MINNNLIKESKRIAIGLAGIAAFVLVWQVVVWLEVWSTNLLPSPSQVADGIAELYTDGVLFSYIGISLSRFVSGYLLAVAIAIPLGLLLGWFATAFKVVNPVLQILRPISPTAWFPFIVLWFGIGDAPAIAIITIAAFFPILFSTASSVAKIDPTYLRVADNFEISRLQFFLCIGIPSAFPGIMTGLRLAIGTAWIFLVSGEMVGAQAGLGYLIVDARNNLRTDLVLSGIVLIGITGWALDALVHWAEKRIGEHWGIKKQ